MQRLSWRSRNPSAFGPIGLVEARTTIAQQVPDGRPTSVDGTVRLFVGAPDSNDGRLQTSKPSVSEQFVGTMTLQGTAASGTGVVMGQYCAGFQLPGPYCGKNARAEIHLSLSSTDLQGDVQVAATGASEWILDLGYWPNYYELPTGSLAGEYREDIAEFSTNGDTIINIDSNGSLFFQSVSSGCGATVSCIHISMDVTACMTSASPLRTANRLTRI